MKHEHRTRIRYDSVLCKKRDEEKGSRKKKYNEIFKTTKSLSWLPENGIKPTSQPANRGKV